jgi:hypothetical protein
MCTDQQLLLELLRLSGLCIDYGRVLQAQRSSKWRLRLLSSRNDKCAVRYDQFVMNIHEGYLYDDVEWNYYDEEGEMQTEKGCWLLCDGGYHKWK